MGTQMLLQNAELVQNIMQDGRRSNKENNDKYKYCFFGCSKQALQVSASCVFSSISFNIRKQNSNYQEIILRLFFGLLKMYI